MLVAPHKTPTPARFINGQGVIEDKIASLIGVISEHLTSNLPTKPQAIVLTGSFAREEGSVLLNSHGFQVLGDMEFMVIFPGDPTRGPLQIVLDDEAKQLREQFAHQDVGCDFEFRAITAEYFHSLSLRPQIFGYELLAHGRTVWGDPSILSGIRKFSPDSIPRWDAWRMLHNRVIEQLEWCDQITASRDKKLRLYYQVIKCYLDLATTLLIFAGKYEDTYAARAEALSRWAIEATSNLDLEFLSELARRVTACTAFKLDPNSAPPPLDVGFRSEDTGLLESDLRRAVLDLATVVHKIWRWEAAAFVGIRNPAGLPDDALQSAVFRAQPLLEKLRGWARLMMMADLRSNHGLFSRFLQLALRGSPRYLVYAVAAQLYFNLPLLLSDYLDSEALPGLKRFLPVTLEENDSEPAWRGLRRQVLQSYRLFLRNHFA